MADNSNRTSNLGPRVSHVTTKAYNGPGHYLIPSWMSFEVDGPANFDGVLDVASISTLAGGVAVGTSGSRIASVVVSTISVIPGAVPANDSVSTTATISTMPADAMVLSAQPASIWSGAYFDIKYDANVSAASTLRLSFANSAITSVTPDAMNWKIMWADPA